MITIIKTANTKSRTFGWVQNPSNFRSLCNVVAVFDPDSPIHQKIKYTTLPTLIAAENRKKELITALNSNPLKLSYDNLVGTGETIRATAACDAIIQAIVPAQGKKLYTDNWTADGFLRWAHCLGFIKYEYTDDTFSITESGLRLSACSGTNETLTYDEHMIIVEAMLSYPPAIRVLSLLAEENAHLTKFEIGRQLGFTSEDGFTSMPQTVFVRALSRTSNSSDKNKMRNNWEGSSDKYARMIARWLEKLDLVEKIRKSITVTIENSTHIETIGQAYVITAQGLTALHRAQGASRHKRIPKTICYEMLATKGNSREYLRTRRSLIIKWLSESRGTLSSDQIVAFFEGYGIMTSSSVVHDDIKGFQNIGLDIDIDGNNYTWRDEINDFVIPDRINESQSSNEQLKDKLREKITHLPHDYLSLIDLAYDSQQNRLFEMKTLQLLTEEVGYKGLHLGGSRKPDGIIFTSELNENYGVIIDTKAYSKGYSLPINQADEMQRYIQENQRRDEQENPNKWWENFGIEEKGYYFMFVSGHFTGKYQDQIDRISRITETSGAAVAIDELLLAAQAIMSGDKTISDFESFINFTYFYHHEN
ncbi:MAG: hypothetical protein FWG88_06240 [Oscillospiraceae bacterium]|nr:hypothetical protein [Oscillospiraceae bacterium]